MKLNFKVALTIFIIFFPFVMVLTGYIAFSYHQIFFIGSYGLLNYSIVTNIFIFLFIIFFIINKLFRINFHGLGFNTNNNFLLLFILIVLIVISIVQFIIDRPVTLVKFIDFHHPVSFIRSFLNNFLSVMNEEVIIRGFLLLQLLNLIKRKGKVKVFVIILLNSLYFALLHLPNLIITKNEIIFSQLVYYTIVGLILSYIFLKFKNIWLTILIHFFINYPGIFLYKISLNEKFFSILLIFLSFFLIFIPKSFFLKVTRFFSYSHILIILFFLYGFLVTYKNIHLTFYEYALINYTKQNYVKAIYYSTKSININPKYGQVYYLKGISHYKNSGGLSNSIKCFEKAIEVGVNVNPVIQNYYPDNIIYDISLINDIKDLNY